MADILTSINTRVTPQGRPARADQVKNNAGGYVFQVGDEARLHRFLTLGTDSNSYYQKASELTRQNADVVFRMAATNHDELVNQILAVSEAGRAPKNKQAIFALAIAASTMDADKDRKALAIMHRVCRTGTMVFEFNKYVEQFRGRGPALNKAVANWYLKKPVDKLAYQVTKYRQRDGWMHRDLLRLTKPGQYGAKSDARNALFDFILKGTSPMIAPAWRDGGKVITGEDELAIVRDYLDATAATTPKAWIEVVNRGHGLSWEMLPDAALKSPEVWEALIAHGMPQTALMRQLPRLTNVFGGNGNWVTPVAAQLQDAERLKKGRVHPINVLVAQRTYASGRSVRGSSTWSPVGVLTDALDAAFYNAFGAVEATGKRILLALDISGSMSSRVIDYDDRGRSYAMPVTAREVTAALALVMRSTEPVGMTDVIGFSAGGYGYGGGYQTMRQLVGYTRNWAGLTVPQYQLVRVRTGGTPQNTSGSDVSGVISLDSQVTPRRRLDDVLQETSHLPHGNTDCALPFTWAQKNGKDFDAVVILTDNETWAGPIHVHQAAEQYRNHVGHDVKLIAAAMTATNYSVVDPKDPSGLNVSGFDSAVPNLIGDFVAGRL